MNKWFVFLDIYKTIIDEAVKNNLTTEDDKLVWYRGVIEYALTGVDPTFAGILSVLWLAVKPIIDISMRGVLMKEEKKEEEKKEKEEEKKEEEERKKEKKTEEKSTPAFLKEVTNMWNTICSSKLPKLIDITGTRRDKLRLRLNELGGNKTREEQIEWLRVLFKKVVNVPFLRGENDTGWKASFDWLIANDYNWKKVMEGKYDGTPNEGFDTGVILHNNDPHKWDDVTEENFWNLEN